MEAAGGNSSLCEVIARPHNSHIARIPITLARRLPEAEWWFIPSP
jgi:hypothetical protein